MKPSTLNTTLLLLGLALATAPLLTFGETAFAGGSSVGGGNAVCNSETHKCKMVEEYQVDDLTDVKGYDLYNQKMEMLRKELPELAKRIDAAAAKKTWYVIPAEFDELDAKVTKLRFSTTQAAYQNKSEVFVSQLALDQMDPEDAAWKLMHESIMAMQDPMDAEQVRILTGAIMGKKASPAKIQLAAANQHLGVYYTPKQQKDMREHLQMAYLEHQAGTLGSALVSCAPREPEVERSYQRAFANANERAKWELVQARGALNSRQPAYLGPRFNSVFDEALSSNVGLGELNSGYEENIQETMAPENASKRFPGDFSSEFLTALDATRYTKEKLDVDTNHDNYRALDDALKADSLRIRQRVVQSPQYLDIMAIQVKLADDVEPLRRDFSKDEALAPFQNTFDRIVAAVNSVPRAPSKATLDRLCGDMYAEKAELDRLDNVLKQKYLPQPKAKYGDDDDLFAPKADTIPGLKSLGDPAL